MSDYLIRKLELRDRLSDEEKRLIRSIVGRTRQVGPNEAIVSEGNRPTESTLILEGYTSRQQILSGGQRQITSVHVPGDFVDLHGFVIKTMDHSVVTLTRCIVAYVTHSALLKISEEQPHLMRLFWLLTMIDAAIHRRWLTAMGRQSALGQTAHLLCELYVRQKEILRTEEYNFTMPLTQAKLADTLGLSAVHTNRVVQDLREAKLIEWQGRKAKILDWNGLTELAEFDPTYLSLQNEPR